jgi:hypothetical protein
MFALWNKTIIVCDVLPGKITKVWWAGVFVRSGLRTLSKLSGGRSFKTTYSRMSSEWRRSWREGPYVGGEVLMR